MFANPTTFSQLVLPSLQGPCDIIIAMWPCTSNHMTSYRIPYADGPVHYWAEVGREGWQVVDDVMKRGFREP